MKRKLFALAALGVAFAFNANAQADEADDDHTVAISIPEVAILDLEGSTSVSLSVEAPTEAGEAVSFANATNNDVWLNYSSINSRVKVLVRRTNNGSGNGYLWGGNNFMEIRSIPQRFVEGRGILNNIYLQYRLTGISTEIPSGTYSTNIVYTLYER